MKCPVCQWEQKEGRVDCERCGLIFKKWESRQNNPQPAAGPLPTELILKTGMVSYLSFQASFIRMGIVMVLPFLIGVIPLLAFRSGLRNEYLMTTIYFTLGFTILLLTLSILVRIPRAVAVLNQDGIRFVDPLLFAFYIRKWTQSPWSLVSSVEAVGKGEWKGKPYCRALCLTTRSADYRETKSFELSTSHPEFGHFLDFLKSKVDRTRFGQDLLEVTKPENLGVIQAGAAMGKSWGGIMGLVLVLVVFGSRLAGVNFQTRIIMILGTGVQMAILGRFWFRKKMP